MISFTIPSMSCGHCVKAITQVVQTADPQATVQADVAQHRVDLETSTPREQLVQLLADAGYAPA